ncbi:hypothetical protein MHH52_00490 [Paenibacillus sp. FSL K6-0276]|uniref:hypothetical protein n=1 Tax=Paenibacillus sp. FSL K6-0276 TaxID=2921450 RepID=UPI0030EC14CA
MNDTELRQAVNQFREKYGTSITFIAATSGMSREHLSRWLHNDSYLLSQELKVSIRQVIEK